MTKAPESSLPTGQNEKHAAEPAASAGGNSLSAGGQGLPPKHATANRETADHATGLARAIERLQQNAVKSPEAKGLQQALEMLQCNQERHAVDTEA